MNEENRCSVCWAYMECCDDWWYWESDWGSYYYKCNNIWHYKHKVLLDKEKEDAKRNKV